MLLHFMMGKKGNSEKHMTERHVLFQSPEPLSLCQCVSDCLPAVTYCPHPGGVQGCFMVALLPRTGDWTELLAADLALTLP